MDITAERSARKRARFATYDDEATGLGRVAPDASRWSTPDAVRRYRRAVILADRYRRGVTVGRGWASTLQDLDS